MITYLPIETMTKLKLKKKKLYMSVCSKIVILNITIQSSSVRYFHQVLYTDSEQRLMVRICISLNRKQQADGGL